MATPFILAILGIFASTQVFAHSMNEDTRIVGEPLVLLFGHKIYNPVFYFLSMFKYIYYDDFSYYYIFSIKYFAYFGVVAIIFSLIWTAVLNHYTNSTGSIHGTAHFAKKKDLKKNGLLKKRGVVCGQCDNAIVNANKKEDGSLRMKLIKHGTLICHPGKVNTLLLAPTGAGKGVGVIFPTLLSYLESMIIYDPKFENYETTSGWRSTFSIVLKFAPTEFDTIRYNPIMEMRDGIEYAFRDSDLIADTIFAPEKTGGSDENAQYFTQSGKSFVTAALLHVRYSDYPDKSFGGIRDFFASGNEKELEMLMSNKQGEASPELGKSQVNQMINTKHYFIITEKMYEQKKSFFDKLGLKIGDRYYDPDLQTMVLKGAADIMQTNAKEKASVWKTIATKIRNFDDPAIRYATGASDFSVDDFVKSEKPISLYLCVPYSDMDRIKAVFRLIISLILKRLTEGGTSFGKRKLKNNILFLLDEFPTLGAFPLIAEQMGVLRGYGCFFLIVCQALNQLVDRYGQNHPFLDHCTVHIVYAPGSIQDAEIYSKRMGNETVHQTKVSRNGKLKLNDSNLNFSDNDLSRALMDASDITRIPGDMLLIMVHGMQPYLGKKVVYYMDRRFKWKLKYKPLNMDQLYHEAARLPSIQYRKYLRDLNIKALENIEEIPNEKNWMNDDELYDYEGEELADEICYELYNDIEYVYDQNEDEMVTEYESEVINDGSISRYTSLLG